MYIDRLVADLVELQEKWACLLWGCRTGDKMLRHRAVPLYNDCSSWDEWGKVLNRFVIVSEKMPRRNRKIGIRLR
ncbi:MAG: hypothetical protein LBI05_00735 [Planctomycetaceae bacterium]|nr:hypothetical protein [Planctomycetaceae bacterium]